MIKNNFIEKIRLLDQLYQQSCDAIGNPPPSVVWTKNNASNDSSNHLQVKGKMLFFEKLRIQDSGDYRCTAANSVGSTWKSLRLKVLQPNSRKDSNGMKFNVWK